MGIVSADIRKAFLDHFKRLEHEIVPSAPIVVKDDPTLMFTNAGMNQFKDAFLGNEQAKFKRIADTQKCLRVSGKHNDLEEVGVDTYHHTMFEMLGNWSFGDYFKAEAIAWAWHLLTTTFGIPESRLYATVFAGDDGLGLGKDEEARDLWRNHLAQDRIIACGRKDNFWEMGETGPCGPCSEIHVDLRSDAEIARLPGKELVNADHPLVVELWNLVFMQYNAKVGGVLEELPDKHVDTGMGFERLAMVLQNKQSNYDTDVFSPLINGLVDASGVKYGSGQKSDIATRVIVDHLRAVSFAIADGQLPSNTGAGYVIRRILRRAVRYGYTYLDLKEPFLHRLVEPLDEQFIGVFPELNRQKDLVTQVIQEEERSFLRTLGSGLKRLHQLKVQDAQSISGKAAFELFDTYGFPVDLTRLIAEEEGMKIDEAGFEAEMQQQKSRSKKAAAKSTDDWVTLIEDEQQEFIGYDQIEAEVRLTRYRKIEDKKGTHYQLVFNFTPFYAESGGQVGDTGKLIPIIDGKPFEKGSIKIKDTQKENKLIVHLADRLPEDLNATFSARVDSERRMRIMRNHSATHLLHAALRNHLGTHVEQKGSLVAPTHLRFDFSHFSKMTEEEIQAVEKAVNRRIIENILKQEDRAVPYKEAIDRGAMALFGEKYSDLVRVITFDPKHSVELCGGTHVDATGQIGLFKITSEGSISSGIRRIEATTGLEAYSYLNEKLDQLEAIKASLKNQKDVIRAVENLIEENKVLKSEVNQFKREKSKNLKSSLLNRITSIGATKYIGEVVDLPDAGAAKDLAFQLGKEVDNLVLVLGLKVKDKANLLVMIDKQLTESGSLNAGQMIREIATEISGGGGGAAHFATAGGKNPAGLNAAIEKSKDILQAAVS